MSPKIVFQVRQFLAFSFFSGMGWVLDFSTFSILVKFFDLPSFFSNFVSSYVGVTLVWFASLKSVFNREIKRNSRFLIFYWIYQLMSILAYSAILHPVAQSVELMSGDGLSGVSPGIMAKIIITPFNLLTNFIFMKCLMHFISRGIAQDD